ncbi:recombinase family protein [Streptomyces sp. NPDC002387]|uniref:recombinase family protein n=1 Tax=unclassified Streptomyces TaxID=2593676 RepID=UPI0036AEBCA6
MTKPRKRASLLARLSKQADDSNVSLDGMIEDMRALCEKESLEEVALHIDDGLSGGYRDRPGYIAWLDDARTGACDVLINYHTDRLTREGLNVAASILDTVEGKDPATGRPAHLPVRLLDCNGLDSLHGDAFRFQFVVQAEVGRAERERIRERNRNRTRRLRRAGRWPGGTTPYGYKAVPNPDGPGVVLDLEPDEATVVREAAEAILAGDNATLVSRRLNHAGVKPRRGQQWSRNVLVDILTNESTLGRITMHGRPVRDEDGEILAPYPPVLTIGQVAALRAALAPKEETVRRGGRKPARLLSGLLYCNACGTTLQIGHRSPKSRSGAEVVYRCPARGSGHECPKPVTVSALNIEQYATDRYLATAGHMPYFQERTVVSGVEELAAVEADIKDTLADMATDATTDTFARLQRLQARRDELSAQEPDRRTELIPTGFTMAEHWERSMVDDRRAILADALDAPLALLRGVPGRKGFDPARLVWRWADEHSEADSEE